MHQKSGFRTDTKQVRGLGSSHSGTHHFWIERLSALALVPLSMWFVVELVQHLIGHTRVDAVNWLQQPVTAFFMAIFVSIMFIHSRLGIQVIIEDYVHCEAKKITLLLLSSTAHIILGLASVVAIAHVHFIGM